MELYASPMACSLASHITAYEADLPITIHYVNGTTKRTDDGRDYRAVAPNGYVPALRLASGEVLNEGPSVLQYLADQKPESKLAPAWGTPARYRLIDTLNYLSTEVHKRLFSPIFGPAVPQEAKDAAKAQLPQTLDHLSKQIGERGYLVGDSFTVADAYFVTLLNWYRFVGVDLQRWPNVDAYHTRHLARPAVARAMGEEMEERKRRAA